MTHPQMCSWLKDNGVRLRNNDRVVHPGDRHVYTVPHCMDYGDVSITVWYEKHRTAILFPIKAIKACELLEPHWCKLIRFNNMVMFNRLDIVKDETPLNWLMWRLFCEVVIAFKETQ